MATTEKPKATAVGAAPAPTRINQLPFSNKGPRARATLPAHLSCLCRMILVLLLLNATLPAEAQSSLFTYQGRLQDGGLPANGTYDFQFTVWDALTGGTQLPAVGPVILQRPGVQVTGGVFTVQLDFSAGAFPGAPNVFAGPDRFLEVGVRHNSVESYTLLSPRQQITSTPYAVRSATAASADAATTATTATFATYATSASSADTAATATNTLQLGGAAASQFVLTSDARLTSGTFQWQLVTGTSQLAQPNTGYVASNASVVTITLPQSPSVGSTLRVSGAGPGGWKIAQNAGQSILGANLGLDTVNWTAHESNRLWSAVASSSDGVKLVAADGSGLIYTSADSGVTWTPRANSQAQSSALCSSADGTRLAAVSRPGFIVTSADSGATWTYHEAVRNWRAIASSADGSKLVAAVTGGQIYTSTDFGMNWTARATNRSWLSVASSADGTKLAAAPYANDQIYLSTNSGVTWAADSSTPVWYAVASSADGTKLVAVVNGGQIYLRFGAFSWLPYESNRNWYCIASSADGTKLVAGVSGGLLYTSRDSGATWAASQGIQNWVSVASSADGSKLVAVAQGGRIYTASVGSPSSTTPGTAGYLLGGPSSAIELQYNGAGQWLPISHEGTFLAN